MSQEKDSVFFINQHVWFYNYKHLLHNSPPDEYIITEILTNINSRKDVPLKIFLSSVRSRHQQVLHRTDRLFTNKQLAYQKWYIDWNLAYDQEIQQLCATKNMIDDLYLKEFAQEEIP